MEIRKACLFTLGQSTSTRNTLATVAKNLATVVGFIIIGKLAKQRPKKMDKKFCPQMQLQFPEIGKMSQYSTVRVLASYLKLKSRNKVIVNIVKADFTAL